MREGRFPVQASDRYTDTYGAVQFPKRHRPHNIANQGLQTADV